MTIPWLRLSTRVAHFLGVTLPEETDFEVGVEAWGRGDVGFLIKALSRQWMTLMSVAASRCTKGRVAARLGRIGADQLEFRSPARGVSATV